MDLMDTGCGYPYVDDQVFLAEKGALKQAEVLAQPGTQRPYRLTSALWSAWNT